MDTKSLLKRAVGAGLLNAYDGRFAKGEHIAVLEKFEIKHVFNKKQNEQIVAVTADFVIVDSQTMKPGARASELYNIGLAGKADAERESKKLNGMFAAIMDSCGHKPEADDLDGEKFATKIEDELYKALELDPKTGLSRTTGRKHPTRGVAVRVLGRENPGKAGTAHAGKMFVNASFFGLPYTATSGEEIKARRAALDTGKNSAKTATPAAPVAPVETAIDDSTLNSLDDE